jgi:ribosomal-protein-alanine N-acetyltransferase
MLPLHPFLPPRPKLVVHVTIRPLVPADLPAVFGIERESFAVPWTEEDFRRELRLAIGLAADVELGGKALGGYLIFRRAPSGLWISNLAVDPRWRRIGVAGDLVQRLAAERVDGRGRIAAHVGERNLSAQLFLRARGFRAVRVVRSCYAPGEDAYRFAWVPAAP